jgi:hypothetical protein
MWDCFRSHGRLKAEILILRHQLTILHRKAPKRLRLSGGDRALFVWLYRRLPDIATPRRSCVLRQSFAGTGWVFAPGGAGNLTIQAGGPGLIKNPEISCGVCAGKIHFGARRGYMASSQARL